MLRGDYIGVVWNPYKTVNYWALGVRTIKSMGDSRGGEGVSGDPTILRTLLYSSFQVGRTLH